MVYEDQSRYALVANDPISRLATFCGDDVAACIPCAHMIAGRGFLGGFLLQMHTAHQFTSWPPSEGKSRISLFS